MGLNARLQHLKLGIPLIRLAWRFDVEEDAWEAIEHDLPLAYFGSGAVNEFDWYLQGESDVVVETLADVQAWLTECAYARDQDLFQVPDFWQHPRTFEQLRKGDCEDHALWAWRKFHELGIDAELVIGQWLNGQSGGQGRHVWVVFTTTDGRYVLEATDKDVTTMVQRLDAVSGEYIPHMSIDTRLTRRMYWGMVQWLRAMRDRRRTARRKIDVPQPGSS